MVIEIKHDINRSKISSHFPAAANRYRYFCTIVLEAFPLNKSQIAFIDFVVSSVFMELFNANKVETEGLSGIVLL